MKSYTDLEQSKKLAEILPIESADMWIAERYKGQVMENGHYIVEEKPSYYMSLIKPSNANYSQDIVKDIPCWSLTSLLAVIKPVNENTYTIRGTLDGGATISFDEVTTVMFQEEEIIDAVFEMVCYLKENKLL